MFSEDATIPGTIGSSSMRRAGLYLEEVFNQNADSANLDFSHLTKHTLIS
jgi:UDP-N-acetylenolpyruvoylglucosamine reductase